ncbi:MAG TPA: hypothetical protein VHI98_14080 [Vicinamibacterales bacterium]|nr:hypothetical protein [Vicinamibacterales bacterium]
MSASLSVWISDRERIARDQSSAAINTAWTTAVVELPPFGDHVELIAHEFEHIVEQLEGVELRRLANDPSAGVHDLQYAYETERAYKVGQQVARECRRHPAGLGTRFDEMPAARVEQPDAPIPRP